MAVKIIAIIFYLVFMDIRTMAHQAEVDILNYPPYLEFTRANALPERLLQEIFAAALGLTVDTNKNELLQEWQGMLLNNPFNTAEAVVVIYIEGIQNIAGVKILQKYPMILDENDPDLHWELEQKIRNHSPYVDNIIVSYCLTNKTEPSLELLLKKISIPTLKIPVYYLRRAIEVDRKFIQEIEMMKTIAAKVQSGAVIANNIIDFYSFKFCTLGDLLRAYPESSLQMEEAKKIISEAVQDLTKAFVKAYQSSVLVAVVATEDKMNTRRTVRDYLRKSLAQSDNFKFFKGYNERSNILRADRLRHSSDDSNTTRDSNNTKELNSSNDSNNIIDSNNTIVSNNTVDLNNIIDLNDTVDSNNNRDSNSIKTNSLKSTTILTSSTKVRAKRARDFAPPRQLLVRFEGVWRWRASWANALSPVLPVSTIVASKDDDAPMFHIFLWTSVSLFLSVQAIVSVFMNMDPGRDTVVYRMTDPRIKRD